jgi:protoheme IX farnesyltransferase
MLYWWVNPLTMWLTFATFVGYAVIYTVVLKPMTPQNIVIGGASGAMPPVLGWAAMRNEVGPEALMLCLIIFLWTPPHFWALALYRAEDYRKSGLPMLPVTHGPEFTRLQVLLYTFVLFAATLLPFVYGMSGWLYLAAAVVLGLVLHRSTRGAVARLQRRPGAQDLPFFHLAPVAAVRGAAARPLPERHGCTASSPDPRQRCRAAAGRLPAAPWAATPASRRSSRSTSPAPTTPRN